MEFILQYEVNLISYLLTNKVQHIWALTKYNS